MLRKRTILLVTVCMLLVSCSGEEQTAHNEAFAMDTFVTVTANGKNAGSAAELAIERIRELEGIWSVTDSGSDIYRINHEGSGEVHEETAELIDFSVGISAASQGAFDITLYPILREWGFTGEEYKIPDDRRISELLLNTGSEKISVQDMTVTVPENMQLDLGAVGKGAAGDIAAECLRNNGIDSALLNLGGSITAIGTKPGGESWKIGVRSPFGEENAAVITASDCSVVTSGAYERYFIGEDGKIYGHILDPETGRPAESDLASATVVGSSGRLCDALSTALFVMGSEKAEKFRQERDDFEMLLITNDGGIIITEELAAHTEIAEGFDENVRIIYPAQADAG